LDDELRSCLATIVGYAVLLDSTDARAREEAPRRIVATIQQLSDTLERRAIEAAAEDEATPGPEATRRALLLDEDADSRRLVRRMLPPDLELLEVVDAEDALDAADAADISFVILSWRASGFSGPETLNELKIRYPTLPVIVIANENDEIYAGVADVLGADAFITRPVNSLRLLTAIDDVLELKESHSRDRPMAPAGDV
jgi:PleD family two-component response regulator